MNAQRLSSIAVTLVLTLSGLAQAQGPWPTLNTPSFFSPVNEFFSPRPYSTQYQPYAPSYNGTQIIPAFRNVRTAAARRAARMVSVRPGTTVRMVAARSRLRPTTLRRWAAGTVRMVSAVRVTATRPTMHRTVPMVSVVPATGASTRDFSSPDTARRSVCVR